MNRSVVAPLHTETHPRLSARILRQVTSTVLTLLPAAAPRYVYTTVLRPKPIRALTNAILRSMIPNTVVIPEGTIILNPDDPVVSGALMLGVHEPTFRTYFTASIFPGMTVLDIGANIGYYTLIASKRTGDTGRVISFEPEDVNASILDHMVRENALTNVSVSRVAIGATNERSTLYLDPHNKGKHTLVPTDGNMHATVQTKTLTSALLEYSVRQVDLIKMDIEGWEAKAFQGMWDIIERDKPELFFECAPVRIRKTGEDPVSLLARIRDLGYELSEINDAKQREVPIVNIEEFTARFRDFDEYADIHARAQVHHRP